MANNSTDFYDYSDGNLTKGELTAFFIILVLILASGLIGNILSIVIWRKGNRCSIPGFATYFQLLSVSDLMVLLLLVTVEVIDQCKFYQTYMAYYENILMHKTEFLCKFVKFCWYCCPQVSAWITVALTIERTLSISFPIKFYRTNASKRAYIVCGVILLASFALNAPIAVLATRGIEIFPLDNQNGTATNDTYTVTSCLSHPDSYVQEYISSAYITFAIPLLILTFCNITLLVKLCKSRRLENSDNTRRQRSIRNVTQLVFGVSVLQCLTGPIVGYIYTRDTPFEWLRLEFINNNWFFFDLLATACYHLNSSIHWVLYSLIGKDFREDLKDLLKKFTRSCAKPYDRHEPGGVTPVQMANIHTTEQSEKRNRHSTEQVEKRDLCSTKQGKKQVSTVTSVCEGVAAWQTLPSINGGLSL